MTQDIIQRSDGRTFEDFKHVNEHEAEYWDAREIQPLFGYGQWRSFESAIKKAITDGRQLKFPASDN